MSRTACACPLARRGVVSRARETSPAARTSAATRVYRLKAELFRTLGHPARIRLLELLGDGERTVAELQEALELDSSGVSQHLAALRRQGLLESRRVGTTRALPGQGSARADAARRSRASCSLANLEDSRALLDELDAETGRRGGGAPANVMRSRSGAAAR